MVQEERTPGKGSWRGCDAPGTAARTPPGGRYLDSLRMRAPVRPGDVLHGTMEIVEIRPRDDNTAVVRSRGTRPSRCASASRARGRPRRAAHRDAETGRSGPGGHRCPGRHRSARPGPPTGSGLVPQGRQHHLRGSRPARPRRQDPHQPPRPRRSAHRRPGEGPAVRCVARPFPGGPGQPFPGVLLPGKSWPACRKAQRPFSSQGFLSNRISVLDRAEGEKSWKAGKMRRSGW